jgi:hypothetical protein
MPGEASDMKGRNLVRWLAGSVGQWVVELTDAVLEYGASGFILFSPGGGTPDAASLGRWATEIAPVVRDAISKNRSLT